MILNECFRIKKSHHEYGIRALSYRFCGLTYEVGLTCSMVSQIMLDVRINDFNECFRIKRSRHEYGIRALSYRFCELAYEVGLTCSMVPQPQIMLDVTINDFE